MFAKLALALTTLLLIGCVEVPEQPMDAGPGAQGGPPPNSGAQIGPAGGAGAQPLSGAGRMQPKGFEVEEGAGVAISGTVVYEGQTEGTLRIDFLPASPDQGMPGAVHSLTLEEPGAWTVEAPQGYGDLLICAFIDTNDDGPSRGEPKVLLTDPLTVGTDAITAVELVVQDDWDKDQGHGGPKELAPDLRGDGKAPPEGAPPTPPAAAPAPGEAPAE